MSLIATDNLKTDLLFKYLEDRISENEKKKLIKICLKIAYSQLKAHGLKEKSTLIQSTLNVVNIIFSSGSKFCIKNYIMEYNFHIEDELDAHYCLHRVIFKAIQNIKDFSAHNIKMIA